jgi:hypothetical protein
MVITAVYTSDDEKKFMAAILLGRYFSFYGIVILQASAINLSKIYSCKIINTVAVGVWLHSCIHSMPQ